MPPLLEADGRGLYCAAGDFHIDPWVPVERAVVTHAHSDHARWGCKHYLTSARGVGVLHERVGAEASIEGLPYGEVREINGVRVSIHPAGHILGSGQIRVEHRGEVWVASGDYKIDLGEGVGADPTVDPFEPVKCHTFISESTFGLPIYRWKPQAELFAEINDWWRGNIALGRVSVIFAYALGKAQRILAGVDASLGPIVVHGTVTRFLPVYAREGIALPACLPGSLENAKLAAGKGLVVAPPSALGTPWLRKFGPSSLSFASGWMTIRGTRRRKALDRGFVISDHTDWPGLHAAVRATECERLGVTHGYVPQVVRWFREQGLDAFGISTHYEGEQEEAALKEAAEQGAEATDAASDDGLPMGGPGAGGSGDATDEADD